MAYTDVHRGFLQACSNHGSVSSEKALEILIDLSTRYGESERIPTEDDVPEVVARINERIYRFDQKIAYTHYEPNDTDYYVFINLQESPIALQQNYYTKPELHYFRVLLRELVLHEDHELRSIACLNLTNESASEGTKVLSKARAEELISEWENLGYFVLLEEKYYLGPKTIVEFDKYLNNNYGDVMTRCCLCNVTIFYGIRCAHCPQILHKDCMKKYLRRLTNCPACKQLWSVPL